MDTTCRISAIELTLERYYFSKKTIIGSFFLGDLFLCSTLEPNGLQIPEGVYKLRFSKTPTWSRFYGVSGYRYQLRIMNVPDREGILFHIGNTYKDSEGCVLVGDRHELLTNELISNSRITYSNLCDLFHSIGSLYDIPFDTSEDYIEFVLNVKVR